jgi:hypothetical protein
MMGVMAGYPASELQPVFGQSGVGAPTTRGSFKSPAFVIPAVPASTSPAVEVVDPLADEPPELLPLAGGSCVLPEVDEPLLDPVVVVVVPLDVLVVDPLVAVVVACPLCDDPELVDAPEPLVLLEDPEPLALWPEESGVTEPPQPLETESTTIHVKALVRLMFLPFERYTPHAHTIALQEDCASGNPPKRFQTTRGYTLKKATLMRKASRRKKVIGPAESEYYRPFSKAPADRDNFGLSAI